MPTKSLDHAIVLVPGLAAGVAAFGTLGFVVSSGGQHPGWGTHNAMVNLRDGYVEILSVHNRSEALAKGRESRVLVDYLDAWGAGIIGFAIQTTEIERDAERLKQVGVEADGPYPMERSQPDGSVVRSQFLVPFGLPWGRFWPFLIQWDDRPAQESEDQPNGTLAITRLRVAVEDLDAAKSLYESILGTKPTVNLVALGDRLVADVVTFRIGGCELALEVIDPAVWPRGKPPGPSEITFGVRNGRSGVIKEFGGIDIPVRFEVIETAR